MLPRNVIILCLAVLLAGCGAATTKKMNDLTRAIDDYAAALRWSRIDDARRYHRDRDGERPDIDSSAMEHIRVTGYKIRKRVVNEELDHATVTAELDYYNDEYGTLKHTTVVQEWWYDPESEHWYIESGFPAFE